MSDYDSELEEYEQLKREYNNLVDKHNRLVDRLNRVYAVHQNLEVDCAGCQQDVLVADSFVAEVHKRALPPITKTGKQLVGLGNTGKSCDHILDELSEDYRRLKRQSSASKNMTQLESRYYFTYGSYAELRNIALGYIVGVDSNIWSTDAPRKTVEKAYLENVPYWVAPAVMAVMLWASNEEEAANRAIAAALKLDRMKSTLFFMLVNLRFERIETAKQWYELYFAMLDENNITSELQYVLQAILCGALGKDREFESRCADQIVRLLDNARKRDASFDARIRNSICQYFNLSVKQTDRQYTMMRRSVAEYESMLDTLSKAEANAIILEKYRCALDTTKRTSSLSRRIEDTLEALISAKDAGEQEMLNSIRYYDFVIKCKGDEVKAKAMYDQHLAIDARKNDIGYFFVNIAMSDDPTTSPVVRSFAMRVLADHWREAADAFANAYRSGEHARYNIEFDGWRCLTDENGYDNAAADLTKHYDKLILDRVQGDSDIRKCRAGIVLFPLAAVALIAIFAANAADMIVWQKVLLSVLTVVCIGGLVGCIAAFSYLKQRIIAANQSVKENGLQYLRRVLDEMAQWRAEYKKQDSRNNELKEFLN